jgi:hypothetical protein
MKQTIIKISTIAGFLFFAAGTSFAASMTLSNGGLGQVATKPSQFGVAVCNKSGTDLAQAVPIIVTTNGESATISSVATIQAGTCSYSYLPYSQLGMTAGQTYSVNVIVDPQHSVSSNSDNATVYTVTVPAQTTAAQPSANLTANISSQFPNPLVAVWDWLGSLYHSL